LQDQMRRMRHLSIREQTDCLNQMLRGHYAYYGIAGAADALVRLAFRGKQTQELQGQRDLDYTEATTIIGKAIGKPDLAYIQAPDNQVQAAMVQMGMSENFAGLILELAAALNTGHMRALEPRTASNTTPTKFETFVAESFVPAYQQQAAA
jgi:hypothetical protein